MILLLVAVVLAFFVVFMVLTPPNAAPPPPLFDGASRVYDADMGVQDSDEEDDEEEEEDEEEEHVCDTLPPIDYSSKHSDWLKVSEAGLGKPGKEGDVFEVKNVRTGARRAMKVFRSHRKSKAMVLAEAEYQQRAAEARCAPRVTHVICDCPLAIVMELMVKTVVDVVREQGSLTTTEQIDLKCLAARLDHACVYHNDANALNLMIGGDGCFRWIDYGMAKNIEPCKHGLRPNTRALRSLVQSPVLGLMRHVGRGCRLSDFALLMKAADCVHP